jgi:hypothetical protein
VTGLPRRDPRAETALPAVAYGRRRVTRERQPRYTRNNGFLTADEVTCMEMLRNMGLVALFSLLLTLTPLVMAVAYIVRPSERRLALMRPLSLAGLFAALTGTTVGLINVLVGLGKRGFTVETYTISAIGSAEALVPLFLGFANLTVAWLLIAAGMGRQRD